MGRFRAFRGAAVAVAAALALSSAVAVGADAATTSTASDEIGGTSVAAHLTAQNFRNAWLTQVAANGGTASSPMTLNQPTYTNGSNVSGVINTAADGTTTSVARTRYTAGSSPTLVGPSTNPGTATCTSAGESLQGGAPRPTLLNSDATCSNAAGFAYNEVGGTGENTTRDAVEFTFSRPVLGFGAWFGDLETRTDGSGLPALVRLYDAGGTLVSEKQVVPGPNYLPQSNCGGTYTGCGNNTTRWISFVADPALPVTRMVVIVGDDDPTGSGLDEGMSFIGPTLDLSRATISLAKTANPLTDTNSDGIIGAGDTIHYKFTVTNTGSLTVTSVAITDPSATGISCPVTTLAASASVICTGNHVLTQAQVNAGSFSNTASATASAYGGTITSNSSTLVFPIASSPGLTLTKTVTEPTYAAVGDVLHFQLTATNTGNVTLTGLSVSDPNPGAGSFSTTCGAVPTTLAPHSSTSCAATYAVTQADLNAGTLTNIGSASATAPGSVAVGPVTGSATSIAIQQRGLSLQKSVDHLTYDAVGNVLTYTLTATNTGNVTMTGVNVTDTPPGAGAFAINCAALPSTLAPGAQGNCTATYTVTQDDLDSGTLTNVAQAHGTAAGVAVNSPPASATSTVVTHPGLGLAKTVDAPSYAAVGDVLTYTISLTNSGNVRVHGLSVDDTAPGAGAFNLDCSALPVRLQPGATATCTATYAVTQADLDAGTVVNQAQASGLLPNNDPVTSPLGSATSVAQQSASLSLVKTADPATYSEAGDVVSYDVTVTNEGNVTLHGVTVTDPAPGSGAFNLNCAGVPATLGPGDVGTCTASYAVTQADVDAGSVENVASVTATGPSGTVTAPDASVTTTAEQVPELRVRKRVDLDTYSAVGDVLTYTITVTNTGNVTLTGVDASDAAPGDGAFDLDCASLPSTLAPGAHGTCTATYTVTQTDLDAGAVVNSAQGTATSPTGLVDAASLPVTSTAVQSATIQVQKMVNAPTYDTVGDVLTYPITVTNTGNVTLTSVAVDDVSPGTGAFSLDCSGLPSTLAPGGNGTCTATYTVTQADLDSGSVTNAATASGVGPSGTASAPESRVTSTANQNAALSVRKSVDADVYSSPGDVLTYTITVTNSGNVTLSSVDVDDPAPGAGAFALDCGALPAVLAPGGQGTCTATYAVTQADVDGGSVTNEASASASSPAGPVDAASLPVTSTALAASDLQITKTVDASSYSAVGDVLTYTITVTNNGNVTLDNVEVADPAPGAGAFALDCTNLPSSLAPAADGTCTATYAVTQADLDAGTVVNTAQANATDPSDNAVHSSNASATSTAAEAPSIDIDKSVDATLYRSVGDVLTYTIIVTNNGNVTLTDVAATDIAPGGGAFALDCAFLPVVLAPNDSGTCTATYAVTQQDLNVGSVTNTADVSASSPAGPVGATSPGVTSTAVRSAALDISKDVDASTYDAVGDVLTYTITATNTGNVTIHSVDVADAAPGTGAFALDCGSLPAVLAPGDNGTCTATYTVTQADLDGGTVANTAHASGVDPGGDPVRSGDATATSTADESAAFDILKAVDAASYDAVGDVLTYTVAVTNSGNVTLTGVNVTDVAPGSGEFSLDCASLAAVLAPGDGGSCTATYTVTQADLNTGHVTNVAHAHGTAPGGPVNAASAPVTSLADQTATLDVRKTVDAPTYDAVGDVLTYTVTVTNSGNVTLSSVALTDAAPGSGAFALDCGGLPSTLAPGEHGDCSATYSVTQADLDAGSVTNTARADAVDPNAAPVRSPNDSATSTAAASGALQVAKSVDAVTYDAVGEVLTFSVTVTNAGNVTLTGVDVVDAAPGAGTFSLDCAALPAVLAPGDGGSCTATYVVTQADLDGGSVVNRAHAIGTDPANDPVRSANDSATSTAVVSASLGIVKSVDTATYDSVGDVLTYTIDVTNTGNVTLAQVDLVDHAPGDGSYSLDCASLPSILAPGDGGTCTATYSVTQADLDAGSVVNTAHAEGTDPSDNPLQSADATATSTFNGSSSLAVTKTVDAATYDAVGDLLTYTVTVTNAGSVTLSDVIVTDVAPGPGAYNIDCGALPGVLEPGDTGTCTATYAVTQADLDAGSVVNVAFADAVKPGGDAVRSSNASATSTSSDAPSLGLVKTVGTKTYDAVGDILRYTITVTNTGNVRLSELTVTDEAPGGGAFALDCTDLPDALAPGDSGRCSATYSVTQADLDTGSVVNTAHASAVDPRGRTRNADAASASSAADQVEALTVAKVVREDSFAAGGDVLHYKITTRNTGNVTLRHVEVDDPAPGNGAYSTTCGAVGSLAPGAVSTCEASYTITSADLESDGVTNTATVSATGQVSAVSASATSDAPTDGGGESLPGTGAKNLHHLGFAGIGLLLLGFAFIVASRRRRT